MQMEGRRKKQRNEGKEQVCKLFQPSKLEVFIGSKAPGLHSGTHTHTDPHTE